MRRTSGLAALVLATALVAVVTPSQRASADTNRLPIRIASLLHLQPSRVGSVRSNIQPSPDYFSVCAARGRNTPTCIKLVVEAIDRARSHEHMKKHALVLPRNYRRLSVARQTFVITNLERVDRGLRPFKGLTAPLNHLSNVAAGLRIDPSMRVSTLRALGIGEWGSIWAEDLGPLAADYDWMYNDGYSATSGINIACQTPTASGCWGHRNNILYSGKGYSVLSAGAGTSKPAGASIAEVLVCGYGRAPKYVYTWRSALLHGANGHQIAARFRRTHHGG